MPITIISVYVARGCDADGSGNLIVSVRNDTTVTIAGVQVSVSYTDTAGRPVQQQHNIRGQIAPGQIGSVNTGMGPYVPGNNCPANVIAARIVE